MKQILFIMFSVLLAGATFQSCMKSDTQLKNDVDKALVNHSDITTTVKDGVVTLSGTVSTEVEKTAIESMVKPLPGVKSVVNNITALAHEVPTAPAIHPDSAIQSSIESRLSQDGYDDVKVEVINGEVVLTGDLKRTELQKVMQIANEANPQRVTNKINLK